ncbi:hypothetical protein PR048_012861 [Dryococelus australis]|uniref:Uncharacterized protein n=1 Tax=Dryococelus australis TaxID=614101 RepID=A0ABQ9HQK2_9NEOP|nr:hypothetical protein PR048_012861 [Dryococelus australis]
MNHEITLVDLLTDILWIISGIMEQHVNMRSLRYIHDNENPEKLIDWLTRHLVFPKTHDIMPINTGIVVDEHINCHMSQDICTIGILNIIDKNFYFVIFKHKDRVIPL